MKRLLTLLLCCSISPGLFALEAHWSPLVIRNLTPVSLLYGVPSALGATTYSESGTEYSFSLDHVSNFTSARTAASSVFFDGETTLATYTLRRGFRTDWEWGLSVPLLAHTPGFLDGSIDQFHDFFGFPDGGRSVASRNRLDYLVQIDGEIYANFQDSKTRLSDARIWVGRQLRNTSQDALTLRAQVKLPTGKVDSLSGSEAADVAMWFEYTRRLGEGPLALHLLGGATYLGEGELAPQHQEDLVWFGEVGLQYRLNQRWQLLGQLSSQSRILDTGIKQVQGAAVQGSMGARVRVTPKLQLDLAFIEDIKSRSSADIVFQARLSTRLP